MPTSSEVRGTRGDSIRTHQKKNPLEDALIGSVESISQNASVDECFTICSTTKHRLYGLSGNCKTKREWMYTCEGENSESLAKFTFNNEQ